VSVRRLLPLLRDVADVQAVTADELRGWWGTELPAIRAELADLWVLTTGQDSG